MDAKCSAAKQMSYPMDWPSKRNCTVFAHEELHIQYMALLGAPEKDKAYLYVQIWNEENKWT